MIVGLADSAFGWPIKAYPWLTTVNHLIYHHLLPIKEPQ
jgi:hypothetical protein